MSDKTDKIVDIPKLSNLKKDLEGMELIKKYSSFLTLFGVNPDDIADVFDELPAIKEETEKLLIIPDKFNSLFAKRGWIAHESMDFNLMTKAVELAENGNIEDADNKLADHFCSEDIKYKLFGFNAFHELKIRHDLIKQAQENTRKENYLSAVPLLLIIIDGIVNDIDKNKGFFATNTTITAWDSMAAHKSGLSFIKDVFNKSRKKTSTEQIDLPYRNGILHGRDLGFGNKIVTGKCWATLIAIYDWVYALNNKPEENPNKEISLKESLENLKETKRKSAEISEKVKNWTPRDIIIGKDIPQNGTPKNYKEFSPEREVVQFTEYWKKSNYGYIAKQIRHFEDPPPDIGKTAREIREILDDKKFQSFQLNRIVDEAPSISEVTLTVNYLINNDIIQKEITLRLTCIGKDGEITVHGDKNNCWKFFLFSIRDQLI